MRTFSYNGIRIYLEGEREDLLPQLLLNTQTLINYLDNQVDDYLGVRQTTRIDRATGSVIVAEIIGGERQARIKVPEVPPEKRELPVLEEEQPYIQLIPLIRLYDAIQGNFVGWAVFFLGNLDLDNVFVLPAGDINENFGLDLGSLALLLDAQYGFEGGACLQQTKLQENVDGVEFSISDSQDTGPEDPTICCHPYDGEEEGTYTEYDPGFFFGEIHGDRLDCDSDPDEFQGTIVTITWNRGGNTEESADGYNKTSSFSIGGSDVYSETKFVSDSSYNIYEPLNEYWLGTAEQEDCSGLTETYPFPFEMGSQNDNPAVCPGLGTLQFAWYDTNRTGSFTLENWVTDRFFDAGGVAGISTLNYAAIFMRYYEQSDTYTNKESGWFCEEIGGILSGVNFGTDTTVGSDANLYSGVQIAVLTYDIEAGQQLHEIYESDLEHYYQRYQQDDTGNLLFPEIAWENTFQLDSSIVVDDLEVANAAYFMTACYSKEIFELGSASTDFTIPFALIAFWDTESRNLSYLEFTLSEEEYYPYLYGDPGTETMELWPHLDIAGTRYWTNSFNWIGALHEGFDRNDEPVGRAVVRYVRA